MLGQILKSWNFSLFVFFLHFNFAYHTNKAPCNKSLRRARIQWLWHLWLHWVTALSSFMSICLSTTTLSKRTGGFVYFAYLSIPLFWHCCCFSFGIYMFLWKILLHISFILWTADTHTVILWLLPFVTSLHLTVVVLGLWHVLVSFFGVIFLFGNDVSLWPNGQVCDYISFLLHIKGSCAAEVPI